MKLLRVWLCVLTVIGAVSPLGSPATAHAETTHIVIAHVVPNAATASQEYVAIYNNSDTDQDITNWCVKYNGSSAKPGCLVPPNASTRLILAARSYTTFASHEFVAAFPGFVPDARPPFTAGLADSGGTLTLVDESGLDRDQFGWTKKQPAGTMLGRQSTSTGTLQDTDSDAADIVSMPLAVAKNTDLYEQQIPTDVCPNMAGLQEYVPDGYGLNGAGNCVLDQCLNIAGLQETIPNGYEQPEQQQCRAIPLEPSIIHITEIYPNPPSYDTGQEFVELYNPNDHAVSLRGYQLQLGPGFVSKVVFGDTVVQPRQRVVVTDVGLGFVLPNSSGSLRLLAADTSIVSETPTYVDAPEGESWALVSGDWQFTDMPTPGEPNIARTNTASQTTPNPDYAPCAPGKYRSPLTNRCRATAQATSNLTPCAPGQYRSPDTNRCRKLGVLASSLAPCRSDQVRNPATNRCRQVSATESTAKPCQPGYERNPDTNRCRKAPAAKPQLPQDPATTRSTNNVFMVLVLGLTLGYAAYEYRYDVVNIYRRLQLRKQLKRAG